MNSTDFLLSVIAAFGGQVDGRTLLQKRAYFISLLTDIDPGLNFDAHYYGPYSATIDNTLGRLRALGFINEENTGFGVASTGFEIKRYDYKLTEDGQIIAKRLKSSPEYNKINEAAEKIIAAGNPNYLTLSIAAKAIFMLRKRAQGMSTSDLVREARKFDWDLTPESLDKAVEFLEQLQMIKRGSVRN